VDVILLASNGEHYSSPSLNRATGSHRIASYLRQHNYTVDVIDFATHFSEEELYSYVLRKITSDTKVIGFGGTFFIATPQMVNITKRIKKKYPRILIVAGSQVFENTASLHADYHIVGYGETAMLKLLRGEDLKYTTTFSNGKNKKTVFALHDYPAFPMRDLSIDYTENDYINENETLTLECSRGCIFRCSFCSYPILGVRDDHTVDAEIFSDNLKRNYDKWGVTNYNLADETFNDYPEKIRKYADVVEKLPFEVNFGGYIRADLMTNKKRDDIEHLARMRFNSHFYGIESFNYESARSIGKGGDPEYIKDKLLEVDAYMREQTGFYQATIALIAGLPHETMNTLDDSINWLNKYWRGNNVSMYPLTIPNPNKMHKNMHSVLSNRYEHYGYEAVDPDDIWSDDVPVCHHNFKEFEYFGRKFLQRPTSDYTIRWSNPNMNMYEASKRVAEFYFKDIVNFGETPFRFNEWTALGYTLQDMNKSYADLGGAAPPLEKKIKYLNDYKAKKLS
jgi:radical SAM superfamily enzyme YgiQ (UPF0313 family)